MTMDARSRITLATILAMGLMLFGACSDDTTDPDPPNQDVLEQELEDGFDALEEALFEYLEPDADDPDAPDDIDFSGAEAHYRAAYNEDSSSLEARFGLGVTSMLILSVDQEVNEAFDEWETYLDTYTPFDPDKSRGQHLGIPLGLPSGSGAFDLPFDVVSHTVTANIMSALDGTEPQLTRIQDIVLDIILPRVEETISLLGPVVANPDFTYIITGRMQGDDEEDSVEIDTTDILALRAACELLAAGCHVIVAYDLQMADYNEAGLLAALNQTDGTMFRLRSGGAGHMATVPVRFHAAIDDVDAAITSLLGETDDQDDDVIKTDPDDLSRDDLLDFQAVDLPQIWDAFDEGTVRTEDWDDDGGTPEVALTINLHDFFDDPPQDLKQLLPAYTITTELAGHDGETWDSHDGVLPDVTVEIDSAVYELYYQVSYEWGEFDYSNSWSDCEEFVAAATELVEAQLDYLATIQNWTGSADFSFYYWGSLDPGTHVIDIEWNMNFETADSFVHVPRITWIDQSFDDWAAAWPNPTVSGLLPEMTSGLDVCNVFGFREYDWEQSYVLDWSDIEADGPSDPPPPGR